ncbi:hypothetical protein [Blastococcus sp. TF02A-26]|uniref:hypothetical protein n=1 Tax=Blastococcus sp. TF02A-26 TaxID=2250577 RepID=UPI000DE93D0C|nr:hypothetical protein [Blastococcus sp. TF02A-26]RBY85252.1 hypothetical protein DQ240_11685 [Blastococcus sp. TF02A-26]
MTDSYGTAAQAAPGYGAPAYPPPGAGYGPGYGAGQVPGYDVTYGAIGHGAPQPSPRPVPAAPASAFPAGPYRPVLVATAAAAVLVVGAGVAAAVAGAIIATQADDVGREIGAELGRAQNQQMDQMMDDFMSMDPYASSGGGVYGPLGPVEQSPPVAPGDLGPDPVLNGYAEECFAGDLQACDDLFFESPPMSDYEEYASTCGGRVKIYTVPYCTELE